MGHSASMTVKEDTEPKSMDDSFKKFEQT